MSRSIKRSLPIATMLASLGLVVAATLPAAAQAHAPAVAQRGQSVPIAISPPYNGSTSIAPLIAYDPASQTTYVAWTADNDSGVNLCVLPPSASNCEGGAPVLLTDPVFNASGDAGLAIGGLTVLPGGEAAVIGTPIANGEGSVAWTSPAGGAAFLTSGEGLQNGGNPISSVSLFYTVNNAVALSSTDVALLDDYGDFFQDTALSAASPALTTPNSNANNNGLYPRKALETNGSEIAAEPAPAPAPAGTDVVVGVGDNFGGPGTVLPGCVNSAGTGYGVSVGQVNGTSDAAGTLNSEGLPNYGLLACAALSPVLAQGGKDGIGVLDEEGSGVSGAGSDWNVVYHPFEATATGGTFGPGVVVSNITAHQLDGAEAFDLSEDAGTGVYASWVDEQGLVLDYSGNGGATWYPPVVVPNLSNGAVQGDPTITGVGSGDVLLSYDNDLGTGDQVYVQVLDLIVPEPTTLSTSQASGTTHGASLTIAAGTVGETDHATIAGSNAGFATGTVSYDLYSSASCSASSLVANLGAKTVTAGVVPASSPVSVALAPGTYYWHASYSGDQVNDPSASTCGSEVLTVTPPATTGGTGTSTGTSVTITITCAVTPCTVTVTITIDPPGPAFAGALVPRAHTVEIAGGTFKLKRGARSLLPVKLTSEGKLLIKEHHERLTALATYTIRTTHGVVRWSRSLKIVP